MRIAPLLVVAAVCGTVALWGESEGSRAYPNESGRDESAGHGYGPDMINYTATDDGNTAAGRTNMMMVPVNDPPVLMVPTIGPAPENDTIAVTLEAVDADNSTEELTFGADGAPDGLMVSDNRLSWTPAEGQGPGDYTFNVTVTDGIETVLQKVTITVTEANQNPVFDDTRAEHHIIVGEPFALNVVATDADIPAQTISYEISSDNVTGAKPTINQTTGMISWVPDVPQTVSITIRASDDHVPAGIANVNLAMTAGLLVPESKSFLPSIDTQPVRESEVTVVPSDTVTVNLTDAGYISAKQTTDGPAIESTPAQTQDRASANDTGVAHKMHDNVTVTEAIRYATADDHKISAAGLENVVTTLLVPIDDNANTNIDSAVDIDVLDNDIIEPALMPVTIDLVIQGSLGSAEITDRNTIQYTPNDQGQTGTDSFQYRISSGDVASRTATVTVTVSTNQQSIIPAIPTVLVANQDASLAFLGETVNIDVLANDVILPEGVPITIEIVDDGRRGSATVAANNTIQYTPGPDVSGSFGYRISGAGVVSNPATVFLYVTEKPISLPRSNMPPVANDFGIAVTAGESTSINLEDIGVISDGQQRADTLKIVIDEDPAMGGASIAGTTITYNANAGASGTDTFVYRVTDMGFETDTGTVTVTIRPTSRPLPNTAPAATYFDVTVDAGHSFVVDLAVGGHITDAEQAAGTLETEIIVDPKKGTAHVGGTTIGYLAGHNATGIDAIPYRVTDDGGLSDLGVITVFIKTLMTNDDEAATDQDTTVNIDVLANDIIPTNTAVTITVVDGGLDGSVSVNRYNDIVYTPDTGFTGMDTITYLISNGDTTSNTATVQVHVTEAGTKPINTAPLATDFDVVLDGRYLHVINLVGRGNISDAEQAADILDVTIVSPPISGFAVVQGTNIIYSSPSFVGGELVYMVTDDGGLNDTGTITISRFTCCWDVSARRDTANTHQDTTVNIDVLANDRIIPSSYPFVVVLEDSGRLGFAEVNRDNTIRYTPSSTATGSDIIRYSMNFRNGDRYSNTAEVNITINPDHAPQLGALESQTVRAGGSLTYNVPVSNTDYDISELRFGVVGAPDGVTVSGDRLSWTPTETQIGVHTFAITVRDPEGFADQDSITITVAEANQSPVFDVVAEHDAVIGEPFMFDATATDADLPAQAISYEIASHNATGTPPTIDQDNGMISWTPDAIQTVSITVRATDDHRPAGTANTTITVRVFEIIARDDAATSNKVDTLHIHATANDMPDTVYIVALNLGDLNLGDPSPIQPNITSPDLGIDHPQNQSISNASIPTATLYLGDINHNDTHIIYEPSREARLLPDGIEITFQYTLNSHNGTRQDQANVTITFESGAEPIEAVDDMAETPPNAAVEIDVLVNDIYDRDGPPVVPLIVGHPGHGMLNYSAANGTFTYTPDADYIGQDTFIYEIRDIVNGRADNATVTIAIDGPLSAPDIDVEAIPGILTPVQPDIGAGITIESAMGAAKGTIAERLLLEGTIAYTANAGESGIDVVTYTIADDAGNIGQGTVRFYINEQNNDRPALETVPGIQTDDTVTFQAASVDDNDEALTYAIRNAPAGATIDSTTGAFSWNTTGFEAGDYIFDVIVHDDSGGLDVQKMVVTVRDPANGSPTAPVVHRRTTPDTPILITPDIRDPEGLPTGMILAVGADKGNVREEFLEANIIAYVPQENGTDIISYTTSDGAGGATTSAVYIHTGDSSDPDLEAIGVQRTETSQTLTFQASVSDEDSPDISYVMSDAPDGATLDESTGSFSWTPGTADAGDHIFTITAYDNQGGFDTEPVAISVSEPGVTNRDPNISDFDSVARQNNPRFIALETSDPDDDPTGIILATNATMGTMRQNLLQFGIITYVPQTDWTGTDTVTYVVSDGRGGASTGTIYVHVRDPANDEPVLDPVGNRQVSVPDTLTFDVSAFDNEGDPLTYAIRNAPAGATMTPDGTFSWTPAASDAGDHEFTVTVHDDAGGFATERIIVTVTDPTSTNRDPTAPDESVTAAGDQIVVLPGIDDPDGDDTAIIAVTNVFQGLVDPALLKYSIIAYTPFGGALGAERILYTVSDGRGGLATGIITITINAP